MSELVSKFYTKEEKLGLKKHKYNKREGEYLDKFGKLKQINMILDEDNYNLKRVHIKFHIALNIAIF